MLTTKVVTEKETHEDQIKFNNRAERAKLNERPRETWANLRPRLPTEASEFLQGISEGP